jgi:hypothetical protein
VKLFGSFASLEAHDYFCPSHLAITRLDVHCVLVARYYKKIRNHTFFGFENEIFDDESDET